VKEQSDDQPPPLVDASRGVSELAFRVNVEH
jgi:hypothetical protein